MKKILAYITPEKQAGFFDLVVGYDSNTDVIIPYTNVKVKDVKDVIYGAVFTRNPIDLKNTAIFIGGHDFTSCQELFDEGVRVFETLPEKYRVSLTLDPDGACTTAASCVAKVKTIFDNNLSGKKIVILAGTGPVGRCSAIYLAREERAIVSITSRKLKKAERITKKLKEIYGVNINALQGSNVKEIEKAIENKEIVISTGPEGIMMLPKSSIENKENIKVLVDVNAVPPSGIECVKPNDKGNLRDKRICFGAIGIGNLKIKVHHELVKALFNNQKTFNLKEIYEITKKIHENDLIVFGNKM